MTKRNSVKKKKTSKKKTTKKPKTLKLKAPHHEKTSKVKKVVHKPLPELDVPKPRQPDTFKFKKKKLKKLPAYSIILPKLKDIPKPVPVSIKLKKRKLKKLAPLTAVPKPVPEATKIKKLKSLPAYSVTKPIDQEIVAPVPLPKVSRATRKDLERIEEQKRLLEKLMLQSKLKRKEIVQQKRELKRLGVPKPIAGAPTLTKIQLLIPLQPFGLPKPQPSDISKFTKVPPFEAQPPPKPDPWKRMQILIKKANIHLMNHELDLAEMYYKEMQPLFLKLSFSRQKVLYPAIQDLQNRLIMMELTVFKDRTFEVKK